MKIDTMEASQRQTGGLTLYDFRQNGRPAGWTIVNDGVMGGLSKGSVSVDEQGNGIFRGTVSIENNGGFSLARLSIEPVSTRGFRAISIALRGDGKRYQLRIKSRRNQMHAYTRRFDTSGEWERITVRFDELMPTFRGRRLDLPAYAADQIEEIGFLIGNKKKEDFELAIQSIGLE